MRDFKGVHERIEPRFGNDRLESEPESAATSAQVMHDVLLDAGERRTRRNDFAPRPKAPIAQREQGYANASPQNKRATRRLPAPNATRKWRFSGFNRTLITSVLLVILVFALYLLREPLIKVFERPIKSVVVEGEFNLITKARATELISREIDGDFLQLNLMRLKSALLVDPWVEKVTLNRRWPDTLVVKIVEQKPIARWDDGFLNQRGEIVRVDDATALSGLPWLQGNEANAIEILQQYQDFSQILRSRGLDILALKCDNKKSWRLTIKNHVEIALGRDQVMEKIRRFVTVYDTKLNGVWADVKAIDLRYSNGVAVRWVADSEMAKKYIKSQPQVDAAVSTTQVLPRIN